MRYDPFTFRADDGEALFVHRWLPDGDAPRAVVHVAHGMAEHGARYAPLAAALTAAGCAVYANDHRGHGLTARTTEDFGHFGPSSGGGWRRVARDLEALIASERAAHPRAPMVLFGHSMGSFLVQDLLPDLGSSLRGAVLSGSAGKPDALASAGRLVARAERLRLGDRGRSRLLHALSFGAYNDAFAPARTPFDWLSRDPAQVDAYVRDPYCGFACTTSLWVELLDALAAIASPARQARIPADLPIYVFAGTDDPVGKRTKSLDQLVGAYRAAGLCRVEKRYYPGGRHEMLNETNRDEVIADLLAWLGRTLGW